MSEHQHVEFRAVDRPLTDEELAFARQQSTRAEITRWSFQNEYHYGDFRGDALGLLRNGYDVYLHYANYGVRRIALRLPIAPPRDVLTPYLDGEGLEWRPDDQDANNRGANNRRRGGVLWLCPYFEPDDIDEVWDFDAYVDAAVTMRGSLLAGDLRALYVLWLCNAEAARYQDAEVVEPPVPYGLADCVDDYANLLTFFGVDPMTLAAAAEGTGAAPEVSSLDQQVQQWAAKLPVADARRLVQDLLTGDAAAVRAETIASIRSEGANEAWPTAELGRTCEELFERCRQLREKQDEADRKKRTAAQRRAAVKKARERQERMGLMATRPQEWIRKADKLVAGRGVENYEEAAEILADLREALGDAKGDALVRRHAAHLASEHPTLSRLKSALRKRNLWD